VPDNVLGAGDIATKKKMKIPTFMELTFYRKDTSKVWNFTW
jgi:hypothetical protein